MSFTLKYPAVGSTTDSVVLRNPEIGDLQRINGEGIVRRTRGGDLKVYRDNNWPQGQVNVYEFTRLTSAQKSSLLSFLEDYAGLEIGIEDHHEQNWTGIIISNPTEIINVRGNCSIDASFEFLGEKV